MKSTELFQAALKASGSEMELARRLGYENVQNVSKQFGRWSKGHTQMSFDHTIAMLEIAGWLCVPDSTPHDPDDQGDDPEHDQDRDQGLLADARSDHARRGVRGLEPPRRA